MTTEKIEFLSAQCTREDIDNIVKKRDEELPREMMKVMEILEEKMALMLEGDVNAKDYPDYIALKGVYETLRMNGQEKYYKNYAPFDVNHYLECMQALRNICSNDMAVSSQGYLDLGNWYDDTKKLKKSYVRLTTDVPSHNFKRCLLSMAVGALVGVAIGAIFAGVGAVVYGGVMMAAGIGWNNLAIFAGGLVTAVAGSGLGAALACWLFKKSGAVKQRRAQLPQKPWEERRSLFNSAGLFQHKWEALRKKDNTRMAAVPAANESVVPEEKTEEHRPLTPGFRLSPSSAAAQG